MWNHGGVLSALHSDGDSTIFLSLFSYPNGQTYSTHLSFHSGAVIWSHIKYMTFILSSLLIAIPV
jgi:hypothetical protein